MGCQAVAIQDSVSRSNREAHAIVGQKDCQLLGAPFRILGLELQKGRLHFESRPVGHQLRSTASLTHILYPNFESAGNPETASYPGHTGTGTGATQGNTILQHIKRKLASRIHQVHLRERHLAPPQQVDTMSWQKWIGCADIAQASERKGDGSYIVFTIQAVLARRGLRRAAPP